MFEIDPLANRERSSREEIAADRVLVSNAENIELLLDQLPYVTLILNRNRHIVYANYKMIEIFNLTDIEEAISSRPGELMHCIHSADSDYGCGAGEACRYCGFLAAVMHSMAENRNCVEDCRVSIKKNGGIACLDLRVNAAPAAINDKKFVVVSIIDISVEKHKERLEQIFFHDVLNTVGGIMGMLNLIDESVPAGSKEYFDLLRRSADILLEEMHSYKDIINVEKGKLKISLEKINTEKFLAEIVSLMQHYPNIAKDKQIIIRNEGPPIPFKSDICLARRIIINMIKNALEATPTGQLVTVGYTIGRDTVTFKVHNNAVIEESAQYKIFQRSFSTKGTGRGIGTYSMKMFMTLLGGKVRFDSCQGQGTTFYAQFPLVSPSGN